MEAKTLLWSFFWLGSFAFVLRERGNRANLPHFYYNFYLDNFSLVEDSRTQPLKGLFSIFINMFLEGFVKIFITLYTNATAEIAPSGEHPGRFCDIGYRYFTSLEVFHPLLFAPLTFLSAIAGFILTWMYPFCILSLWLSWAFHFATSATVLSGCFLTTGIFYLGTFLTQTRAGTSYPGSSSILALIKFPLAGSTWSWTTNVLVTI